MTKTYGKLADLDAVRVNAVIIEQFRANPDDFIKQFRDILKVHARREKGFQHTLDHMRAALVNDLTRVPPLKKFGMNDALDLKCQSLLLNDLKKAMGAEAAGNEQPTSHYQHMVRHYRPKTRSAFSDYELPKPAWPYTGAASLIAKTWAMETCLTLTNEISSKFTPEVVEPAPMHAASTVHATIQQPLQH